MKVQLEQGDYKYALVGLLVVAFLLSSWVQYSRNKDLRQTVKDNNVEIKVLKSDKERLLTSVSDMEVEKLAETKRADSMEVQETYFKNRYYVTKNKLQKIQDTYDAASTDDKNKLFTGALSDGHSER